MMNSQTPRNGLCKIVYGDWHVQGYTVCVRGLYVLAHTPWADVTLTHHFLQPHSSAMHKHTHMYNIYYTHTDRIFPVVRQHKLFEDDIQEEQGQHAQTGPSYHSHTRYAAAAPSIEMSVTDS